MKIVLLDIDKVTITSWKLYFGDCSDVEIVEDSFGHFMNTHKDIDCVVSPANSYGLMDGGYDLAITDWFGKQLMKRVQEYIIDNYYGEQPVASSFIIDTNVNGIKLIHTPTMRIPSIIRDEMVIYHSMRSTLITALDNNVKCIVIPAFGGGCGMVHPAILAKMMYMGYEQIMNPPKKISWGYAERTLYELERGKGGPSNVFNG